MARWWIAILLGWLLFARMAITDEREHQRELDARAAGLLRDCDCASAPIMEEGRPAAPSTGPAGAPAVPAPLVHRVELAVDPVLIGGAYSSSLTPWAEFAEEVTALRLTFTGQGRTITATVRRSQLDQLGWPICNTNLPFAPGTTVALELRALTDDHRVSPAVHRTVVVTQRDLRRGYCPTYSREHCDHTLDPVELFGVLMGLGSFIAAVLTVLSLFRRAIRIAHALVVPSTPYVAVRAASALARSQSQNAVMCGLIAMATMIAYPEAMLLAVVAGLGAVLATWRWWRARGALAVATSPGAYVELRAERIIIADGARVITLVVGLQDLAAAVRAEVPAATSQRGGAGASTGP